jgi:hypothetical protein
MARTSPHQLRTPFPERAILITLWSTELVHKVGRVTKAGTIQAGQDLTRARNDYLATVAEYSQAQHAPGLLTGTLTVPIEAEWT